MKKIVVFITVLFSIHFVYGQCGFDSLSNYLNAEDENYNIGVDELNQLIYDIVSTDSEFRQRVNSDDTYMIPVVVHVLHKDNEPIGVGSNISDDMIFNAIQRLNDDFSNVNGSGIDINMKFCLAQRDPDGNSTNGINRINASQCACDYDSEGIITIKEPNSNEAELKAMSIWPKEDYINIWTVSEIDGNNAGAGFQGFAYLPPVNRVLDGVVSLASGMTPQNTILTHEIAHFFGVYHTFEGDCMGTCCPNSLNTLDQGDRCEDTPPHQRPNSTITCTDAGTNVCYSIPHQDYVHNYMSYSDQSCHSEFSNDQRRRMRTTLMTERKSLMFSTGCLEVCDEVESLFDPSDRVATIGASITFDDLGTPNYDQKWYVDGEEINTGFIDLTYTFNDYGEYFVCLEVIGNNCSDMYCEKITIVDHECVPTGYNFYNGDFEDYVGPPPTQTTGFHGRAFINDQLFSWSSLKYTPDFLVSEGSRTNLVKLTNGFLGSNEGVFSCYDFEEGKRYALCMDIKGLGRRRDFYAESNARFQVYLANDIVVNNGPDVGEQLILSVENWDFPNVWGSTGVVYFIPDKDYENVMFINRYELDRLQMTEILIDNIQIYPTDGSGFGVSDGGAICEGESLILNAFGGTYYSWSPTTGLSCTDCPSPLANPTIPTNYEVEITYGNSCPISKSLQVFVDVDCSDCQSEPSIDVAQVDDCRYRFTGLNTGDPGIMYWDVESGPTDYVGEYIEYEFALPGSYDVCLNIACDEYSVVQSCVTVNVDDSDCTDCTDGVFGGGMPQGVAMKCPNGDTYQSNVQLIVDAGYYPCGNGEIYIEGSDIISNSYVFNSVTGILDIEMEFSTTPSGIYRLVLCGPDGTSKCMLFGITNVTDCDECIDLNTTVVAECVDATSGDGVYEYAGEIEIILTSYEGLCGVASDLAGINIDESMVTTNQGVYTIPFTMHSNSLGPQQGSVTLCIIDGFGQRVCYNLNVSIETPCDPDDGCEHEIVQSLECDRVESDVAYFDFDHILFIEDKFEEGYELCDPDEIAIDGGSTDLQEEWVVLSEGGYYTGITISIDCEEMELLNNVVTMTLEFCNAEGETFCVDVVLNLDCEDCDTRRIEGRSSEEDVSKSRYDIYPNPTSGKITVMYTGKEKEQTIKLFDVYGHNVGDYKLMKGHNSIDISNLNNGLYIWTVLSDVSAFGTIIKVN